MFFGIEFPHNFEIYTLLAIILLLIIWIIRLEIKMKKILIGKNTETIDDSLNAIKKKLDILKTFKEETEGKMVNMDKRISKSITGVGLVRFNPFKSAGGGNQSFASAFLNESGDGAIISTLYSRDHVSVFGKPIEKNESQFELSTEEKEAIEEAKNKISK